MNADERILVIKLGAFGDFIQALGPMAAIRGHHPRARITLLTTKPFVALATESGYVDDIWIDPRPSWAAINKIMAFRAQLRGGNFTRVYDLQNNDRTGFYFRLFGRAARPEWVGAVRGASHRNASPERIAGHAFDGHVQTLALAGIGDVRVDTLDWVRADAAKFNLTCPYVLLVPGSAPNRPEKRWPAPRYGELAQRLSAQGYTPVVIGTTAESEAGATIRGLCPAAINLCGRTTILELVPLARAAAGAIGNDTGPMHIIAPTGCPSLVLFSAHSNPLRHAPRGERVRTLQQNNLDDLTVDAVMEYQEFCSDADAGSAAGA